MDEQLLGISTETNRPVEKRNTPYVWCTTNALVVGGTILRGCTNVRLFHIHSTFALNIDYWGMWLWKVGLGHPIRVCHTRKVAYGWESRGRLRDWPPCPVTQSGRKDTPTRYNRWMPQTECRLPHVTGQRRGARKPREGSTKNRKFMALG